MNDLKYLLQIVNYRYKWSSSSSLVRASVCGADYTGSNPVLLPKVNNMRKKIKYYEIPYGSQMFAVPEFVREEVVQFDNNAKLEKYISSKMDDTNSPYIKKDSFGFNYISRNGAIKLEEVDDIVVL